MYVMTNEGTMFLVGPYGVRRYGVSVMHMLCEGTPVISAFQS